MKKILLGVSASLASLATFAEGAAPAIDLSAATTAAQSISSGLTTWLTGVAPTLITVVGAFLVVPLIFTIVRWFKRAGK